MSESKNNEINKDVAKENKSGTSEGSSLDSTQLAQIQRAMEVLSMQQRANNDGVGGGSAPKTSEEASARHYAFWNTQPVPKMNEDIGSNVNEPIHPDLDPQTIRKEPYSLPQGYNWDTLNINEPLILKELYVLLSENYVEDDDNLFRFDYSADFLRWALQPPGARQEWHVAVRSNKSGRLVGFISGIPATIYVYHKEVRMVEINFLCVHKKLRSRRLAPMLIKEVTRRVNCQGIYQAVYTAGVVLPKPVGTCRYWHRSLNPKKLVEVRFSHLSRNMTMQRHIKLYRLPEETKTKNLRPLKASDIKEVTALLDKYLDNYELRAKFDEDDFAHWFMPREDIIYSYVVEDDEGVITDFFSFYSLPSSIMSHPNYKTLRAAYSFYNVSTKTPLIDLISDALVVAKQKGYDVFNALDLMENSSFLEKLKFGIGDGTLQYYIYNWRCPAMTPKQVGIVLQ